MKRRDTIVRIYRAGTYQPLDHRLRFILAAVSGLGFVPVLPTG